jgi:hypothetical protein
MMIEHWITVIIVLGAMVGIYAIIKPLHDDTRELIDLLRK